MIKMYLKDMNFPQGIGLVFKDKYITNPDKSFFIIVVP